MGTRFSAALLLLLAACGDSVEEAPPPPGVAVRLVVQVEPGVDPARLDAMLAPELGAGLRIEPLFPGAPPDDPDELASFFVVHAPGGQRAGESAWDAANRVEEVDGVRQAEPDEVAVLETPTEAARSTCQADDAERPDDPEWSVASIRAPAAWALAPAPAGKRFGEGVRVCHPDTGWTPHDDLDADRLDLAAALDLLTPDGDAHDPLEHGPMLHPGHGTGTASVIVSGHGAGRIKGVAPMAKLIPIRTAKSVIQVFDSDLARAVRHSAQADCDVISMSLGGRVFFGLQAAVRHAVRNDVIVAAAAGNCVRMVVAPAVYDECIAVAGTDLNDKPWRGSSRGRAVTIAGPAQHVWHASRGTSADPSDVIAAGQGTSYAVANLAGAAALWVAFHGDQALAPYRAAGVPRQAVFVALVKATARRPPGWNDQKYGAGILDAQALLQAPLPSPQSLAGAPLSREAPWTTVEALERVFDVDRETLVAGLARAFELEPESAAREIESWGPEFVEIAMRRPEDFLALFEETDATDASARRASTAEQFRADASRRLKEAL